MHIFIISLLVLLLAPVFYHGIKRLGGGFHVLDRIIFLFVAALVLLEVMTHSIEQIGYWALVAAFLGWLLPGFLEKIWHAMVERVHLVTILIFLLALMLHGFTDGVVLAGGNSPGTNEHYLPWAVVLHRGPEAVFLWWLLFPRYGVKMPVVALSLLALATTVGFFFAESIAVDLEGALAFSVMKAAIAGSLLHLAFHDKH